ncbi:hypothetical protein AURDEDRAFT_176443 [Auricularia subglabra TFB-10046 SS5]|uniref:Uncharacterized protein n=1 Tax=Auricularia subglabra (strain TFB-10046 / SS5) TaxID=717982 RepID=J0LD92_AURST|nr:hypothetical protein AURDEDRAFT_176443 [Auricularia subglabra TFB-10046 SS5]
MLLWRRIDVLQSAGRLGQLGSERPHADILNQGGRVNEGSGWNHGHLARIYDALDAWGAPPGDYTPTTAATPSSTNGNVDSDESENGLMDDDDFPDPMQDRDYLEFVLFQRGCAQRRREKGLNAVLCDRGSPCADCRQHEGSYVPRALWHFISDAALEHHVGNYLHIRPTLPAWQPSRQSNIQPPQLVFGVSSQSQDPATHSIGDTHLSAPEDDKVLPRESEGGPQDV